MRREVYLDHNATTPLCNEARAAMRDALEWCGNPSSVHAAGRRARDAVEAARDQVAGLLRTTAERIVFTSGGTESCALALVPLAGPVVTTRMEHPAVLGALADRARFVDVAPDGAVDPDAVARALPGANACSVQWSNHEVGTLNAVGEIARRCRQSGVVFHTDAVQAAGKVAIDVAAVAVDFLAISAHKLGGPMGVGALYAAAGRLPATSHRGGQERGRRPGSENVIGIVGMGAACAVAAAQLERRSGWLVHLGRRLEGGLRALGAGIHGTASGRIGGTVNFAFPGVTGDALVQALDLEGIRVSTGAACTSGSLAPSPVLLGMGLSEGAARGAVRASVGVDSTEEDVDRLLAVLPALVDRVRRHDPASG